MPRPFPRPPHSAPKPMPLDAPAIDAPAAAAPKGAAPKGAAPKGAAPKGAAPKAEAAPKGSWRGGFLLTAPDGVLVAIGPEPNLEDTIFDFRTAEMKKTYPPPPPVGPPIKVNIENRPIDVIVEDDAPAAAAAAKPAAGAAAPKVAGAAAPKSALPLPAGAAPSA
jgi:hypothetical protein